MVDPTIAVQELPEPTRGDRCRFLCSGAGAGLSQVQRHHCPRLAHQQFHFAHRQSERGAAGPRRAGRRRHDAELRQPRASSPSPAAPNPARACTRSSSSSTSPNGISRPRATSSTSSSGRMGLPAAEFSEVVVEMLGRVMTAPLDENVPGLTLAKITPAQRLHELEFYFPLQRLSPEMLRTLLREHRLSRRARTWRRRAGRLLLRAGAGDAQGLH